MDITKLNSGPTRLRRIFTTCIFQFIISVNCFASNTTPFIQLLLLNEPSHLQLVLSHYNNPASNRIFIAAHRGGRENDAADMAPGNSIANITNAVNQKFDLYESDIEILGDGTLIVFHDDVFDFLTNTANTNDLLDNRDLD